MIEAWTAAAAAGRSSLRGGGPARLRRRAAHGSADRRGRGDRARRPALLAQARASAGIASAPTRCRRARPRADSHGGLALRRPLHRARRCPLTAQAQGTWDWTGSLSRRRARPARGADMPSTSSVSIPDGLTVVTWGRLQVLTWAFWDRYCDESYCMLSTDFLLDGARAERVRPGRAQVRPGTDHGSLRTHEPREPGSNLVRTRFEGLALLDR